MNAASSTVNDLNFIKSMIVNGSSENLRIVRVTPFNVTSGVVAFTLLPSGKNASNIGVLESMVLFASMAIPSTTLINSLLSNFMRVSHISYFLCATNVGALFPFTISSSKLLSCKGISINPSFPNDK